MQKKDTVMEIFMQNTFCFGTRAKPKNYNMEAGNTRHSTLKLSMYWDKFKMT